MLRFLLLGFAGSVLLPTIATVASLLHRDQAVPFGDTLLPLATALGLTFLFWRLLRAVERPLDDAARAQAAFLDAVPSRWAAVAIAAAAAASLVLELSVIRWQSAVFEVFAFYKNFGLLTAFAGLGLGYALARREQIPLLLVIPLFAWQFALLIGLRHGLPPWRLESVTVLPVVEQLALGGRYVRSLVQGAAVYFFLGVVFLVTAVAFVPVGQLCGRLMTRVPPLRAYGYNLAGSIAGVLVMLVAGAAWTPPVVWYAVAFLVVLVLSDRRPLTLFLGLGALVAAVVVLTWPVKVTWQQVHSPYQLLELGYSERGWLVIRAAGHYHQRVHDLRDAAVVADPELRAVRDYYDLPYRLRAAALVAIVGAGAGNDVAAALRAGVARVDAIEIDPAILLAGQKGHPERPYLDGRVRPIVTDARSFLRTTHEAYDLLVYGLLDSHILLSHASSVRLDSFVYTVEAFREARARLRPGGLLVVSFSIINDALGGKMFEMLRRAFDGAPPAVVRAGYDGAVVFIQSREGGFTLPPQALAPSGFRDDTPRYAAASAEADVSTDDWPFFYMPRRVYPVSYLGMLALLFGGTLLLSRGLLDARPSFTEAPFFLLGAGFLLVETKAITELGLAFGNTWQVIGIVILSILAMAFFANLLVARLHRVRETPAYLLLLGTLLLGWFVAGRGGLLPTPLGRLGAAVLLTGPLFFSGIAFSALLARGRPIAPAMAANLLGAMFGGLLEYNAMYFGFRALYLLAFGFYALALVATLLENRRGAPVAA
jgi:SAM-dependent methyltransferase